MNPRSLLCATLLVALPSLALSASSEENASPTWLATFGGHPGVDAEVHAATVFDDGGGEDLYVAGFFTAAGGTPANRVASWDGTAWSALGEGFDDMVEALVVFDDGSGSGPALFAGGWFQNSGGTSVNHIAKWDGSSWVSLAGGVNSDVYALAVFDDGSGGGPALYAGGWFSTAGGTPADHVARWDGTSWSALSTGPDGDVYSLGVFDDGGGAELFAGGLFSNAGAVAANRIAKWDGTKWTRVGGSVGPGGFDIVQSMTVFDDGSGPALFAGGDFTAAGGQPALRVAKWDGANWSALGEGTNGRVSALAVHDDGSGGGPELYAGGTFGTAGGFAASRIAKWDGSSWSPLGSGVFTPNSYHEVNALVEYDDGSGLDLYAGGWFETAGGLGVNEVARWDGSSWSALGSGLNNAVFAVAEYDDGSGTALYAGGSFHAAGGSAMSRITKWDGTEWSALGSGVNDTVFALEVWDDGGGPALYAGGLFDTAGGVAASSIAKWDGTSWSSLGSGTNSAVLAMAVFDDGNGSALYAGGTFSNAGGVSAGRIGRWDGSSWSTLQNGVQGAVYALAAHDDGSGSGPALYVGGMFQFVNLMSVNYVASWDGSAWSAVGTGMNGDVRALLVHDDGSGPELFAGGDFTAVTGGPAAGRTAKWDGTSWSALGGGVGMDDSVQALAIHDDGGGAALLAGGRFTTADGNAAGHVAKWDGTSWSDLEGGVSKDVRAFATHDDGQGVGPALFVGGLFPVSPAGDSFLAKWGGGDSFETYCTAGVSAAGCQALASASGTPSASASSGFDLMATAVEGNKDGLFFFGVNGRQANTWGSGTSYQCVVPPVLRAGLLAGSGTPGQCDGFFSQDLNALWCAACPKPAKNPGAAAVVQAQLWYRDPLNTSNQTTSLSDAIEFSVAP
jgi:hypothetical protein